MSSRFTWGRKRPGTARESGLFPWPQQLVLSRTAAVPSPWQMVGTNIGVSRRTPSLQRVPSGLYLRSDPTPKWHSAAVPCIAHTGDAAPKLGLPFAQGVCPTAPMRCGRLEPSRWGPLAASPDWRPRAGIRHRKRRLLAPSSHRIRSTPGLLARRASVQGHYLGVCKRRCGALPPFCRHDRRTSTCSDRPGFDSPGERTPPAHAPCGNHRSCAPPRSGVA